MQITNRLYNAEATGGGGAPVASAPVQPTVGNPGSAPVVVGASSATSQPANSQPSILSTATPAVPAGDWKATLADEWKTHPSLQDIKDVNNLAKSYVNAQQMVGADKLVMPKADASPEEWNKFYTKLGRPENPDGYKLDEVKFPEGLVSDDEKKTQYLKKFHELGLTNRQANDLYKEYMQGEFANAAQAQAEMVAERQATEAELKQEWGADYEKNKNFAKMAVVHFGGEQIIDWINSTSMGNDPNFIRIFSGIGKQMMEDNAKGRSDNLFGIGREAATSNIDNLKADPEFQKALLDKYHPGHKQATEKWTKVHSIAHG